MKYISRRLATVMTCLFWLVGTSLAAECRKFPAPLGELIEIRPRMYAVSGPIAEFDPCNASVELKLPKDDIKQPLVIISHGGAGLGASERNLASELRKLGFATLIFDAYKMNGFNHDWLFWAEQVTNESRQRMNYKTTLGAYEWVLQNDKIDTSRIYFHGLSNGANVVVNIAGAVDPIHVKGVFAEGTMMSGIGVPDKLNVPVRLLFGKLDNYGGRQENEWRWLIKEACALNGRTQNFIQPSGSSQRCNFDNNSSDMTESPIEWYEAQKKSGVDIDVWWYEDTAHGMFTGALNRQVRTWGLANKRYAWTGGPSSAREKFIADFRKFTESN